MVLGITELQRSTKWTEMVNDAEDLVGTPGRTPVRAAERVRDFAQATGPKCHVLQ